MGEREAAYGHGGLADAPPQGDARTAQLATNLAAVRARIARACAAAGREVGEVTLVVVTKFFPPQDVRRLVSLGIHDLGENRDQEAREKYAQVRADTPDVRLHFIGQLQSNKAGSVASYADVVHTVDRPKIVRALDTGAQRAGRRLEVLVQVDLDPPGHGPDLARPELARGGVRPEGVLALAEIVATASQLHLAGLMAVAPLDEDADAAFDRLARYAALLREQHPEATWLSAGMSGDLEAAVRHGATHLRVGTAILGSRPALR